MSNIKVTGAKGIKKLEITGEDHIKNAPGDLPAGRRTRSNSVIELSDLENITEASIVGGNRIEYTESNFKIALGTLEKVISKTSIAKEEKVKFKSLVQQLKALRPGADPTLIHDIWKKITDIVNMAGLAAGASRLLHSVWPYIAGYLNIG